MAAKRKLAEIAKEIDGFLKRFERDPEINKKHQGRNTHFYWRAGSGASGRYVWVMYVSYQGQTALTREQAEKYLEWLKAGNVGNHWKALR